MAVIEKDEFIGCFFQTKFVSEFEVVNEEQHPWEDGCMGGVTRFEVVL